MTQCFEHNTPDLLERLQEADQPQDAQHAEQPEDTEGTEGTRGAALLVGRQQLEQARSDDLSQNHHFKCKIPCF